MNRILLVPFLLLTLVGHSSEPLPIAEPIVVSSLDFTPGYDLSRYSLTEARDTLVAREARKQTVPVWLALSIAHAENWTGDSMAVNAFSGAIGLLQIHPINWDFYPECGDAHITNRKRNVCVGIAILADCLSPTLEETLSCFGGAVSPTGRREYGFAVNRKMRLGWIDD